MTLSASSVPECNSDLVANLNKAIDTYHNAFITEDNAEKKSRTWSCLQESARQYMCLVSHNQKFNFNETYRVLQQSVTTLKDFSPREASYAFECLVKYGHNLILQPWRHDFHIINLTSGYYVHNISSYLQNAQEILIAMGYVNISDISLKLVPNYDELTVKDVSRDCILACQECIILSKMWDFTSDQEPNNTITLQRVNNIRCKNKGGVEEMCRIVLEEIRRNQQGKSGKHRAAHNSRDSKGSGNKSSDSNKTTFPDVPDLQATLESGDHYYDAVSPGDISTIAFSPSRSRRSKSMTFSTSTPKRVSANQSINKTSHSYTEEKSHKGEDVLDGSLSPRAASDVGHHVYQNVPSPRGKDKNSSKSSMNREKTKWHTPMKYKLHPQGHLKLSKLSEREISYLAKESDSEDPKEDLGFNKIVEREKSKSNDNKNVTEVYKPFANNVGQKTAFNGPDIMSGVMQYAKDFSATLFAKSTVAKQSSSSNPGYSKFYEDDAAQSVVAPEKGSKSSYSPTSPYYDDNIASISDKGGSVVSSTDASSWDMKIKSHKSERIPTDEHYYDEPPFSANNAQTENVSAILDESQSTFIADESFTLPYYENVEGSSDLIGFGFGHSTTITASNKGVRDPNNTTYFSCDNSFKSPRVHKNPVANTTKRPAQLDDLEDVWFHALLKKEGNLNYLESSSDTDFNPQLNTTDLNFSANAANSMSQSIYYPAEENVGSFGYDDGYDGDTYDNVDIAMNRYNIPTAAAAGKFNDPVLKANLQKRNSKSIPISKTSIASYEVKNSKQARETEFGSSENPSENKLSFDPWDCKFCTFYNTSSEFICEICCKSKDNVEEDADELLSEGDEVVSLLPKMQSLPEYIKKENIGTGKPTLKPKHITCPQCTLRNISPARICEACGFRLLKFMSPSRTSWLEDLTGK